MEKVLLFRVSILRGTVCPPPVVILHTFLSLLLRTTYIPLCVQVEDMDKFHFKPKELVSSIVAIYVNLGQSSEFCRALPQDGRSFSIELLEESARIMRSLAYPLKSLMLNIVSDWIQNCCSEVLCYSLTHGSRNPQQLSIQSFNGALCRPSRLLRCVATGHPCDKVY